MDNLKIFMPLLPLVVLINGCDKAKASSYEDVQAYLCSDCDIVADEDVEAGISVQLEPMQQRVNISLDAINKLIKSHADLQKSHADLQSKINKLATQKPDLSGYALKSEIPQQPDLSGYATIKQVNLVSSQFMSLKGMSQYALRSDIPQQPDLSGYALKSDIVKMKLSLAMETNKNNKRYALKSDIPQQPDLSGYALKSEIPTTSEEINTTALAAYNQALIGELGHKIASIEYALHLDGMKGSAANAAHLRYSKELLILSRAYAVKNPSGFVEDGSTVIFYPSAPKRVHRYKNFDQFNRVLSDNVQSVIDSLGTYHAQPELITFD